MNESDGKGKGRSVKVRIRSYCGQHGLILGIVMLLVVPMYLLHLNVDEGGRSVGGSGNGGSSGHLIANPAATSAATVTELHDCQVHLQEVERAAKSSLESVKRSNVVVEELSQKLLGCGDGVGAGGWRRVCRAWWVGWCCLPAVSMPIIGQSNLTRRPRSGSGGC